MILGKEMLQICINGAVQSVHGKSRGMLIIYEAVITCQHKVGAV